MNSEERISLADLAVSCHAKLLAVSMLLVLGSYREGLCQNVADQQQVPDMAGIADVRRETSRCTKPGSGVGDNTSEVQVDTEAKENATMPLESDWYHQLREEYFARRMAAGKDAAGSRANGTKNITKEKLLERVRKLEEEAAKISVLNGFRRFWLQVRLGELLEDVANADCERRILEDVLRQAIVGQQQVSKEASALLAGLAFQILLRIHPELCPRRGTGYGEIVDPSWWRLLEAGEAALMEYETHWARWDKRAVALLAIDSYQDERARHFLIELASTIPDDLGVERTKMQVWQLLLNYKGASALTAPAEKALPGALEKSCGRAAMMEFTGNEIRPLSRACWLQELRYIQSLDEGCRDRYLTIRRRLFVADALAPRQARPAPAARPRVLTYDWQDGDERFLPHLLDSGRPFAIVIVEAPISEAGLAWLKEQAESGPWSDDVKTQIRQALVRREERTKQQGQDLRR
jgi:hypothetical protein